MHHNFAAAYRSGADSFKACADTSRLIVAIGVICAI
jgi:hypothetical protein